MPETLTETERKVLAVMEISTRHGDPFLSPHTIRMNITNLYPGTSNIFGALESLEQAGKVGRDHRGMYHLVGVLFA